MVAGTSPLGMEPLKLIKSMQAGVGDALSFHRHRNRVWSDDWKGSSNIPAAAAFSPIGCSKSLAATARSGPVLNRGLFWWGCRCSSKSGSSLLRRWSGTWRANRNVRLLGIRHAPGRCDGPSCTRWSPPHPAPSVAAQLLGADIGRTIVYGILLSIPPDDRRRNCVRRLDRKADLAAASRDRRSRKLSSISQAAPAQRIHCNPLANHARVC